MLVFTVFIQFEILLCATFLNGSIFMRVKNLFLIREIRKSPDIKYITDWLVRVHPVSLFFSAAVSPDLRDTRRNVISVCLNFKLELPKYCLSGIKVF